MIHRYNSRKQNNWLLEASPSTEGKPVSATLGVNTNITSKQQRQRPKPRIRSQVTTASSKLTQRKFDLRHGRKTKPYLPVFIICLLVSILYSMKTWTTLQQENNVQVGRRPSNGFGDSIKKQNDYMEQEQRQSMQGENNNNVTNDLLVSNRLVVGQRPLRKLLWKAGYNLAAAKADSSLDQKIKQVPTWEEIEHKYGSEPYIVGADNATCTAFQSRPNPTEHMISVAGTFNTGTNLLAQLLWENCYMVARVRWYGPTTRGVRWQVPYGKHTPVDNETFRQTHRAENEKTITDADNVLPVVTIRDPYYWMLSMCRHKYEMSWPRNPHRCPNLVPTSDDAPILQHLASIPVRVQYGATVNTEDENGSDPELSSATSFLLERRHESMVHHYNEWYGAYLNAAWPRVIVRYEDLIFRPRAVIEKVCTCAGGKLVGSGASLERDYRYGLAEQNSQSNTGIGLDRDVMEDNSVNLNIQQQERKEEPFHYVKESAKDNSPVHGHHKTGLLEAMLQYSSVGGGNNEDFMGNMTQEDFVFAEKQLDTKLLRLFHYQTINPPSITMGKIKD